MLFFNTVLAIYDYVSKCNFPSQLIVLSLDCMCNFQPVISLFKCCTWLRKCSLNSHFNCVWIYTFMYPVFRYKYVWCVHTKSTYVMFIIEAFKICLLFFQGMSEKHVLLWNSAISWAIPISLLLLRVKFFKNLCVLAIMHTEMALLALISYLEVIAQSMWVWS